MKYYFWEYNWLPFCLKSTQWQIVIVLFPKTASLVQQKLWDLCYKRHLRMKMKFVYLSIRAVLICYKSCHPLGLQVQPFYYWYLNPFLTGGKFIPGPCLKPSHWIDLPWWGVWEMLTGLIQWKLGYPFTYNVVLYTQKHYVQKFIWFFTKL